MSDQRFGMLALDIARNPEKGFFGCGYVPSTYVRISLRQGYMNADGHPFSHGKPLVELEMTMEQLLSLMTMGHVDGGVPCTITSIAGERLKPLPEPPSPTEEAIGELKRKLEVFEDETKRDKIFLEELAAKRKMPGWIMDELFKMFENKSKRFVEMASETMEALHVECEKIDNEKNMEGGLRP